MNRIIDISSMLAENRRRLADLLDEERYNPITGEGSPIPRFKFCIDAVNTIYLPEPMKSIPEITDILKYKTFREYILVKESEENPDEKTLKKEVFLDHVFNLMALRCMYDFEYWAFTCVKIRDKRTKKLIPFKLRKAQRLILAELESGRLKKTTVYAIVVKARQFGGSTLIQIWMSWIQILLHENWHSSIVTDVEVQANRILDMYMTMAKSYPLSAGSFTIGSFLGSGKNKIVKERGCIIAIGSMQRPDSLRSADNSLVHCSEVGLWKKTKGKEPDDLIQTLLGSISDAPDTAFILESTAKGVGNFFHQTWEKNDQFIKIFIPWFKIDLYINHIHFKKEFIQSMTDYEWSLWDMGATIEGIYWYRNQLKKFRDDKWRMQSEFPSTPDEAFSSTGHKFYPPSLISEQKKLIYPPIFIGDVLGDSLKGKDALKNLKFIHNDLMKTNCLWAWSLPGEKKFSDRYIVSVDIGGVSDGADYSSINVIDRIGLIDGGPVERAATWHGHIDADLLAWKAAQIATLYNNALLVVEINSLKGEKAEDTDGVHYITVLDEIVPYYDNLYTRTNPEKVRGQRPTLYGFHMNRSTKPAVMEAKLAAMRDYQYLEYDERAIHEASLIEYRSDGGIGNVEGKDNHDDIEVPTATAIYVSNKTPIPKVIQEFNKANTYRGSIAAAI